MSVLHWTCRDFALSLDRVRVMGIVNVTPDSFSDGGRFFDADAAVEQGRRLMEEGADVLDVGGESSRPGAEEVGAEEELRRVLPVVKALVKAGAVVSVDTRKAEVARAALGEGACVMNDVSAAEGEGMLEVVREFGAGLVLMRGGGREWWGGNAGVAEVELCHGKDLTLQVASYLAGRVSAAMEAGIARESVVIDPGIGFAGDMREDVVLLRGVGEFAGIAPVMAGVSRKRFVGWLCGEEVAERRVSGSVAAGLFAVAQGARILRVHDVGAMVQALRVWEGLRC